MASPLICAIGAGGKTTALAALAHAQRDRAVLLTTTTHIYPVAPPACRRLLVEPSAAELQQALSCSGVLCAGTRAAHGKLGALPPAVLRAGLDTAAVALCEADGAHRLPLKLHRAHEPVLPPETALCLIVAGLGAVGHPVGQTVHRYALRAAWQQNPMQRVTAQTVAECVLEAAQASGLPRERLCVWLNQTDLPHAALAAPTVLALLAEAGLSARAGSLHTAPQALTEWLLPEII